MSTPTILRAPRCSKLWVLGVLFLVLSAVAVACVREDDLTVDQRVYQLSTQLMCPVCDGQTLDQSQAQLSLDMQEVIRTQVEDGASNAEIRAYFVERYGEVVLASPDAGGFNLVAWVMPVVIFLGGALLVGNAFLNMRRRREGSGVSNDVDAVVAEAVTTEDADDELEDYLKRADREMAAAVGSRDGGGEE